LIGGAYLKIQIILTCYLTSLAFTAINALGNVATMGKQIITIIIGKTDHAEPLPSLGHFFTAMCLDANYLVCTSLELATISLKRTV
jgi:hypothetical protein